LSSERDGPTQGTRRTVSASHTPNRATSPLGSPGRDGFPAQDRSLKTGLFLFSITSSLFSSLANLLAYCDI
ncbi:hypothetical protein FRX31_007803, partial [Thalictrum thalictroides]